MSKPIVLLDNLLTESNVTASRSEPGFPASAVVTPFTYDWWSFEVGPTPAYLTVDFGAPVAATAFGLVGDLGMASIFSLSGSSDNVTFYNVLTLNPNVFESGAAFRTFDQESYRYWRFGFQNAFSSDICRIQNITLGHAVEFERCIMKSHAPIPYNRVTQYTTNESGTGQFLGRSIVRQNQATDVEFSMITAPWARDQMQDFVRHAQKKPFYFSWNPADYPDEVGYVWTDEDIGVEYTGDGSLMTASWRMKGISRYES